MNLDSWMKLVMLLFTLFMAGFAAFMVGVEDTPAPPELVNVFDDSPAFEMRYPDTWMYQLTQGMVVFGEESTVFKGRPGPNIGVNRPGLMFTGTLEEPTLEAAMDAYLRRGPLRGDHFQVLGEIASAAIDGRDALAVNLEGREIQSEDTPLMRVYLVATQADNGQFYFFTASSPAEDWEADWPLMEAMLETADIRE